VVTKWRRGLTALAVATATAVAAAATTVAPARGAAPLDWSETAKVGGAKVLRFQVSAISLGKSSWTARITFRNLSHRTVRVGNVFALMFYRGSKITPTTRADAFGRATRFTPQRPIRLEPGDSWTGVIGGKGRPQPKLTGTVHARVVFGPFFGVPGWPKGFFWITDHSRTFNLTPSASDGFVI